MKNVIAEMQTQISTLTPVVMIVPCRHVVMVLLIVMKNVTARGLVCQTVGLQCSHLAAGMEK